ncbi:ADP-ribosyltransferase [Kitasatospora sp. NPDC004240]
MPSPSGSAVLPESWTIKSPEGAGAGAYRPVPEPVAPSPPSRPQGRFDDLDKGYDFEAEAVREAKRLELQAAERELASKARDFDGIDAKEYGAKTWNEVAEKLPSEQKDAVSKYTWGSDGEINGALRGTGPATPEAGRLIPQLDRALEARPIPENVVVHRGTDLGHLGLDDPMNMAGRSFVEKGYMSTSIGDLPAIYQGKEGILHLKVPAGTPGMWVEKAGQVGAGESELLLRRGLTWRVDRVVQIGDQYHVFGEVLG